MNDILKTTVFVLAVCALTSVALGQPLGETKVEWNRFRGPNGFGIHPTSKAPLEWSDTKNIHWKCPLPGIGTSSPIVSGDRVFLTARSVEAVGDSGFEHYLLCVDLKSGKKLWARKIKRTSAKWERSEVLLTSFSAPAADGKHVYAWFGEDGLFAFDMTGNLIWHHATVVTKPKGVKYRSSPIIFDDMVIINEGYWNDRLVAIDKLTGEEKWRFQDTKLGTSATVPIVAMNGDEFELVVHMFGALVGLNPETGKRVWHSKTPRDVYQLFSPVLGPNGQVISFPDGLTLSVTPGIREGNSQARSIELDALSGVSAGDQILTLYKEWVSVFSYSNQKILHDGIHLGLERNLSSFTEPIRIRDSWLILNRNGKAFVLSTKSNPEEKIPATCEIIEEHDSSFATPAVTDHQLILRSDRFLYSISTLPPVDANVAPFASDRSVFAFSDQDESILLKANRVEGSAFINWENKNDETGQEKYDEAIASTKMALKLRQSVLGENHTRVLDGKVTLGRYYREAGNLEEAERVLLNAKEQHKTVLRKKNGRSYERVLEQLLKLYSKSQSASRFENTLVEQLDFYIGSLGAFSKRHQGQVHYKIADIADELTNLSVAKGDWPKAIRYCDQSQRSIRNYLKYLLPEKSAGERQRYSGFFRTMFDKALSIGYYTRSTQRGATLSAGWLLNMKGIVHEASAEAALLSTPKAAGLVGRNSKTTVGNRN